MVRDTGIPCHHGVCAGIPDLTGSAAVKSWWQKFTQLPDLGRWHRHILDNEKLLQDQRDHANDDLYESEKYRAAQDYITRRKIKVPKLRSEQNEDL